MILLICTTCCTLYVILSIVVFVCRTCDLCQWLIGSSCFCLSDKDVNVSSKVRILLFITTPLKSVFYHFWLFYRVTGVVDTE